MHKVIRSNYICVRDYMTYPIDFTETTDNLLLDFCKQGDNLLLIGIEIPDLEEVLPSDARISFVITTDYTVVRFVNMTSDILYDEVLHKCSLQQVCSDNLHLPIQIYTDANDKLVQIVVYENNMNHLVEKFAFL